MKDCIFCKIINDEIPSKTIYEDDIVKVIMNIKPEKNGDLLIILKRHAINFMELTDDELTLINQVLKSMSKLLQDRLDASGFEVITNTGTCQEIKHCHIHLTPGYETPQPIVDLDIIYEKIK